MAPAHGGQLDGKAVKEKIDGIPCDPNSAKSFYHTDKAPEGGRHPWTSSANATRYFTPHSFIISYSHTKASYPRLRQLLITHY